MRVNHFIKTSRRLTLLKTLLLLYLLLPVVAMSQSDMQMEIEHRVLEDGVEQWNRVKAENKKPRFFQLFENIFRVVLPPKDELPFGKSVAFLVGVSEYENLKSLPFVKNDLSDMREFLLGKGGFDTVYIAADTVVTRELVEDYMMNKFPELLDKRDRLLFYYAGHGADSKGITGYMRFSQAEQGNFAIDSLAINRCTEWMRIIEVSHILFIYDCCASGLAFTHRSDPSPDEYHQKILSAFSDKGSRTVITAGTAEQKTYEIPNLKGGGNGVFTRAFLNAAESGDADRNRDGFMMIDLIFGVAKESVKHFSAIHEKKLTPRLWNFEDQRYPGTFIFVNPVAKDIKLRHEYAQKLNARARDDNSISQTLAEDEKRLRAAALIGTGKIYQNIGQYTLALADYEKSLEIAKEIGDPAKEAQAMKGVGEIYEKTGEHDKALAAFYASLEIGKEIGDPVVRAQVLIGLGEVYQKTGNHGEALLAFRAGLEIAQEIFVPATEAQALMGIGSIYEATGEYARALSVYESARKISETIGDVHLAFRHYHHIANIYRAQKQWNLAAEAYLIAVELIEQVRANTEEPSLQISFFEQFTSPYQGLVTSLLALDKGEEAFQVSEQAKARTLVDMVTDGRRKITQVMTEPERQRESELNERIIIANISLHKSQVRTSLDSDQLSKLESDLAVARRDYEAFRRQVYFAHPEFQARRGGSVSLSVGEATQWLRGQARDDLLVLEYLVGDEMTWLFALSGTGKLEVYPIELTYKELVEHVETLREAVYQRKPLGGQLDRLLAPAAPMLAEAKQVCIVPDDVLWNVPFAALKTLAGKSLIETHTVFYAPSLTALKAQVEAGERRSQSPQNELLIMAPFASSDTPARDIRQSGIFAPLPYTANEVNVLADFFGTTPYVGEAATETLAKTEAGKANFLHFATHAFFDPHQGLYSSVVLAKEKGEDGCLEAREIVDLNLNADLVVLSGCDTALGQLSRGEGIIGLPWAFFVAGCSSTIVSQWKVADNSTAGLMICFYRHLEAGMTKAEALRAAQLWMMSSYDRDESGTIIKYNDPFYWAPFILVGDWR